MGFGFRAVVYRVCVCCAFTRILLPNYLLCLFTICTCTKKSLKTNGQPKYIKIHGSSFLSEMRPQNGYMHSSQPRQHCFQFRVTVQLYTRKKWITRLHQPLHAILERWTNIGLCWLIGLLKSQLFGRKPSLMSVLKKEKPPAVPPYQC